MRRSDRPLVNFFHWLGWDRSTPSVAAIFSDDAVFLLAVRNRPLRVTACGWMPLPAGAVRNGEVRLVGLAADALARTWTHLALPETAPLTVVFEPATADVDFERTLDVDQFVRGNPHIEANQELSDPDTIVAKVDKRQLETMTRCTEQAGRSNVYFDPIPAAGARLARVQRDMGQFGSAAVYTEGGGWLSVSLDATFEVVARGSRFDPISSGDSPGTLTPISQPDPIEVSSRVALDGPWQLLVGAALAEFGYGPDARIQTTEAVSTIGWAVEQLVGGAR